MARTPSVKPPKQVSTLTHDEATRRNIPTAELQATAEYLEEMRPSQPVRYRRARPLPTGEHRKRDEDSDPRIRLAASRLLPAMMRDVDGREEERRGTISVFEGPAPDVAISKDEVGEQERVARFIRDADKAGIAAAEIGVFVRSRRELPRAHAAVEAAGLKPVELSERPVDVGDRVAIGTMHLAKGLEFKAVAVMACDEDVLPLAERIDAIVDESDLDDVYETERHLLYVACTRARDRLLVSGVAPGSEFLADLG